MKALGRGSIASFLHTALLFAWIGLWVAAGALALGALGYGALLALIESGLVDSQILSGGSGEIRLSEGSDFQVSYDEIGGATWPVVLPALLAGAVAIGGGLVIVWRLRRLFDSFRSGEPFKLENAHHLRVIWITLLVIELARYAILGVFGILVTAFGLPEGARANLDLDLNLWNWAEILILIVLAEIFREGARLREEQELTI